MRGGGHHTEVGGSRYNPAVQFGYPDSASVGTRFSNLHISDGPHQAFSGYCKCVGNTLLSLHHQSGNLPISPPNSTYLGVPITDTPSVWSRICWIMSSFIRPWQVSVAEMLTREVLLPACVRSDCIFEYNEVAHVGIHTPLAARCVTSMFLVCIAHVGVPIYIIYNMPHTPTYLSLPACKKNVIYVCTVWILHVSII